MVAGLAVVNRVLAIRIQEPPKTSGRKPFSIAANATGLTKVMPVRPQTVITTGTTPTAEGPVLQRRRGPRASAWEFPTPACRRR